MSNDPSSERTCPRCGTRLAENTAEGLCPACLLALNLATQTEQPQEVGPNGTKKIPPPPKSPPSPEQIASQFPQFEILECLGRGGMGVVYQARQKSLDRLVALKILAPEREKDAQFAERFAREARTLAQLNHPSIVTVHDFGETDGMFYLVMEFVDGVNLRHLLKERKLSPEEALAIVPPVCEALQYAHSQGVIHRDIKPENLLLDKQGRIKIADFGIAKILGRAGETGMRRQTAAPEGTAATDPSMAGAGQSWVTRDQVIGTPAYMAPEQTLSPRKVDHRADIYSLGVVLYEMLTGELPASKLQPPSNKVHLDVRIDEIVLRALEKEPERRYQTVKQFMTMVETMTAEAAKSEISRQNAEGEQRRLAPAAEGRKFNPWETTTIAVGTIFFIVMFLVALEEWSRPFRAPLIVMCILGLGICALSLAGLWPFPSPWFPEPNFSSRNLRRHEGSPDPRAASRPRLSPTALFGAVSGFTFVLCGLPFVLGLVSGPMFPGVFMMLLGACSMTLCGWIAVAQIRRFAERLYGLGLATADGLLFPLLALDALIFGLIRLVGQVLSSETQSGAQVEANLGILLFFTLLLAGPLNLWIIRRVWRAVNKPLDGKSSAPVSAAAGSNRGKRRTFGFLAAVAIVAIVLTALLHWGQRPGLYDPETMGSDSGTTRNMPEVGHSSWSSELAK